MFDQHGRCSVWQNRFKFPSLCLWSLSQMSRSPQPIHPSARSLSFGLAVRFQVWIRRWETESSCRRWKVGEWAASGGRRAVSGGWRAAAEHMCRALNNPVESNVTSHSGKSWLCQTHKHAAAKHTHTPPHPPPPPPHTLTHTYSTNPRPQLVVL